MSQVDTGVDKDLINKLVGENKGINLDTPITSGGKAYTVAELLKGQAELEGLRGEAKKVGGLRDSLKTAFLSDEADDAAREGALRTMLAEAGADAAQVDAIVKGLTETDEPAAGTKGAGGGESAMAAELAAMKRVTAADRTERLTAYMQDNVLVRLKDPETKVGKRLEMMVKGGLIDKEGAAAAVTKFRDMAVKDAERAARELLSRKQPGEALSTKDIVASVDLAMERLYDVLAVIPDANLLGRAGETAQDDPLFELGLPEKPVEFPKTKGMDPSKIREAVRQFSTGALAGAVRDIRNQTQSSM